MGDGGISFEEARKRVPGRRLPPRLHERLLYLLVGLLILLTGILDVARLDYRATSGA